MDNMEKVLKINDNFGPLDLGYGPCGIYREWVKVPRVALRVGLM